MTTKKISWKKLCAHETELAQRVGKLVLELGGVVSEDSEHFKRWKIDTVAGELELTTFISYAHPGDRTREHDMLTVFGRFADAERAKRYVDCNPYSGKWNLHVTNAMPEDVVLRLEARLLAVRAEGRS